MPVWQPAIPQGLRPHLLSWVGYDFTSTDTVHHGVPSMGVTVVLSLGEPIDCGWLHGDARHLCDVLVSGLHTTPALIQSRGRQHGLELSLHPLSTRRLLGLPAGELAGSMVDVNDLSWPRHLLDQLRQSTWPRRFHLLAAFLTKRLEQHPHAPRADLVEALARIHRTRGTIPISGLAQDVGLSRRRLSSLFDLETGLSPKQVARIARFTHAKDLVQRGAQPSDVAAMAGYSDQPHLSREWKSMTGWTLRQSKDDFPLLQDTDMLPA